MNRLSRQYHRKLTTNSYNQDFIYYKHLKEPSRSPRYKVHQQSQNELSHNNNSNHQKIQSMKNTLNMIIDTDSKACSKSYNKSVIDYPTHHDNKYNQIAKNAKSVFDEFNEQQEDTANLNTKLDLLTSKLKQIAQKSHFISSGIFQEKKPNKELKSKVFKSSQQPVSYVKNRSIINKVQYEQSKLLGKAGALGNISNADKVRDKSHKAEQQQSVSQSFDQRTQRYIKNGEITKKLMEKELDRNSQNVNSNSWYSKNNSHQLQRSKSKSTSSFYDKKRGQHIQTIPHSGSLKRQPKGLRNDKSVSTFQLFNNLVNEGSEYEQRPRGKTFANILSLSNDHQVVEESAKIKIYSDKQSESPQQNKLNYKKSIKNIQNIKESCQSNNESAWETKQLKMLQPHRADIKSIIINSDGKRFLTISNDYTIKQSTLDGKYSVLRQHEGRVNAMRMIEENLFTGGNDCRLRFEKGNFLFRSPVLEILPHEKQYLNIGTCSSVQLFDFVKGISSSCIQVQSHFYRLHQKLNKDAYFLTNHQISIIDWRVPFPLIKLFQQKQYVQDWISDPYSLDFYEVRSNRLIQIYNSKKIHHQYNLRGQIKDWCWKKEKVYFLTQNQLQIFDNKRSQLHLKFKCNLSEGFEYSKLQVKNNLWVAGTRDGKLIVNSFQ